MRLASFSVAAASLLVSVFSAAADVAVGDSFQDVLNALGEPEGYLRTEEYQVLYYERGRVELRDGRVVTAALVSEERARALRERRAQEELARSEAEAQRRSRLIVEGEQARDLLLSDADFLSSSAAAQVAVWREFARNYPRTPLPDHYRRALESHRSELERQEQESRMAELEDRVKEAELKAALAEAKASRARTYVSYAVPYFVERRDHVPRRHRPPTECRISPPAPRVTVQLNRPKVSTRGMNLTHRDVYVGSRTFARAGGATFSIAFSSACGLR